MENSTLKQSIGTVKSSHFNGVNDHDAVLTALGDTLDALDSVIDAVNAMRDPIGLRPKVWEILKQQVDSVYETVDNLTDEVQQLENENSAFWKQSDQDDLSHYISTRGIN